MHGIGPEIPAHFLNRSVAGPAVDINSGDEDDEDDYTPELPPDLHSSRNVQPVAGPSRLVPSPPVPRSGVEDSDSSDDDVGPQPLPSTNGPALEDGVREFIEREERRRKQAEEPAAAKPLQREEWMLVPPPASALGNIDPTKLKARQFSHSTKSAGTRENSLWTETPQERQQRIADEVSGKKRRVTNADADAGEESAEVRKRRKHEESIRKEIEIHNQANRSASLVEQHQASDLAAKKLKEQEEEPNAFQNRIWDRSRDMSMGGRLMDEKQRSKMIADAKNLSDRFGSSKKGGYL